MVVTLLGTLIGFFGAALPECFKLLKGWQDGRQELAILRLQIEAQAQAHSERLEEIVTAADINDSLAARAPMQLVGIRWLDGLNASVRPVLAYGFFGLYVAVKAAQFQLLAHAASLPWLAASPHAGTLVALWTQEDAAILSAIVAFYFGGRALEKARKHA